MFARRDVNGMNNLMAALWKKWTQLPTNFKSYEKIYLSRYYLIYNNMIPVNIYISMLFLVHQHFWRMCEQK